MVPQHDQLTYSQGPAFTWNGQTNQQQLPDEPIYGSESSALPPPPWEAQLDNSMSAISQPQELQVTQAAANGFQTPPSGAYIPRPETESNNPVVRPYMYPSHLGNQMMGSMQHMGVYHQPMQSDQMGYVYPQQMHGNQMASYGYGYSPEQMHNAQYLEQNMSGLSLRDSSAAASALSYVPSGKPMKPEDKLFRDLVDITIFKPAKATAG